MQTQLIIGLIVNFLPIFELRLGLPIVLDYVIKNSLPITPFILLSISINIIAIFAAFLFLDFLHELFLKWTFYKKNIEKIIIRQQNKTKKLESRMQSIGFLALMFFVSIPLPGTGAWTGALLSWIMGLNRKNSIIAISAGVIASGIIISLLSLGFLSL